MVDEELKPIIFTMWGNFTVHQGLEIDKELQSGNYPIVLGRKIISLHIKSLCLQSELEKQLTPLLTDQEALKTAREEHAKKVDDLSFRVGQLESPLEVECKEKE